jgi:hypothetical protein
MTVAQTALVPRSGDGPAHLVIGEQYRALFGALLGVSPEDGLLSVLVELQMLVRALGAKESP